MRFLWEGNREAPWHSVVEEFTRFGIGYPLGINAATTPDSLEPTLDVRAMAADLWRVRAELAHLRREAENVQQDAARWRALRDLPCLQLTLTKNDHETNYLTVRQELESNTYGRYDDVTAEERQRMCDANTMWELQVYPDTPIGFCVYAGHSLETVVDAALGALLREQEKGA